MNFHSQTKNRGIATLEVTPLVDVVFLLLIFFLLTATYVKNPNLDVNLPKASAKPATSQAKDVSVVIKKDGELSVDGKPVTMEKLEGVLSAAFSQNKESVVVIQADEGSRHGRVVQVMDLSKKVGFGKLAIAVQSSGD